MSARSLKRLSMTAIVLVVLFALSVGAALAQDSAPSPILVDGNPNCTTLNSDNVNFPSITSNFGFKVDAQVIGNNLVFYLINGTQNGYPTVLTGGAPSDPNNSITITSDGVNFDWLATLGIDAVIVKAQDANAYVYIPEATSDENLHPPSFKDISHIEFCYDYEVDVTKDATTTYTRTYNWDITKGPNADYVGFLGEEWTHVYDIDVDKIDYTDSDWAVSGNIVIENNTPFDANITGVTDVVSPDIAATVSCPVSFPYTLPAGQDLTCTYTTPLPNATARVNTAKVTTTGVVGGGSDTADVTFGEPTTEVNASVNVTDDYGTPLVPGDDKDFGPFTDDDSVSYPRDFVCPTDPSAYVNGVYSETVTNTATIDETGDNDDAVVTMTCYAPVISKDADTAYNRDWDWTIVKTGDQSALTLSVGQSFIVNYDVTVAATKEDSDFKVFGTITVVNPHPTQAMVVALADVLSDTTVATITADADCDYAGGNLTIPAGGTATCGYEAAPADADPGTNTATATIAGVGFPATANYAFGDPDVETDECIDVVDDQYGALGTVCAVDSPKVFEYSLTVGPYDACGRYTYTNVASFVTNDNGETGSDNHVVNINVPCGGGCTLTQGYWKTHSKYGPAPYDDTWALLPDVDGDGVSEGEDETFFLSGQTWYEVLWTSPSGGNAYYIYAHQYIAAVLNQLNGASSTTAVNAALKFGYNPTATLGFLEKYGPDSKLTKAYRTTVLKKASILDKYNNGLIGPGHCSEDVTSLVSAEVNSPVVAALPKPIWLGLRF